MASWSQALLRPVRTTGRLSENLALHANGMGLLVWRTLVALLQRRVPWRETINQAYVMGAQSVPLVLVTGVLSGVVTTQQGGYQFSGNLPTYILGSIVSSSIVLELGPLVTGFVIIARVGARITAEIGTMQVSEQVDALLALGKDPVAKLAAPRIIAGIIVMPILVVIADAAGIFAGLVAADTALDISPDTFLFGVRLVWHTWDLFYSVTKGVTFGFVIATVSVHMGLSTRGGAEGVGRATTQAVVAMLIIILALDALFPPLLLQ